MKSMFIILLCTLVSACSGRVYTVKKPQFTNSQTEGVIFYGYKIKTKTIYLDRIRHPKTGDITHSIYEPEDSKRYCIKAEVTKKVIEPDYGTLYAVKYEPGLFETNTFAVTLDKGMLASVNSQSTPGVKTAVESLQGLASLREDILNGITTNNNAEAMITLSQESALINPMKCTTSI